MYSDLNKRNRPAAWRAAILLMAALPSVLPALDPVAKIKPQMMQDRMTHLEMMQLQTMLFPTYSMPPLQAFIRVHSAAGKVEGMGMLEVLYGKDSFKPRLAFVELTGRRYFPEDTDSIQVWDITGIPKDRYWVFVMAKGPISIFTCHPGKMVEKFTRVPPDSSAWLNVEGWKHIDTISARFPTGNRPAREAARGDRVMAFRIYNEGEQKRSPNGYITLLDRAESLCGERKFSQAEPLLATLRSRDPHYPRLHYIEGQCKERQGDRTATEAYRLALRYCGFDVRMRDDIEKRLRKLEPASMSKEAAGTSPAPK